MGGCGRWSLAFLAYGLACACSGHRPREAPARAAAPSEGELSTRCFGLGERLDTLEEGSDLGVLVRASAPKWIKQEAEAYAEAGRVLAAGKRPGAVGALARELSDVYLRLSITLLHVASSIERVEAFEYTTARDEADDLYEAAGGLLDQSREACEGLKPATPPPPSGGRLPKEHIQTVVRAAYDQFKTCYRRGLAQAAELAGRVTVRFVIAQDGTVENVRSNGRLIPKEPDEVRALYFLEKVNDGLPAFQGAPQDMPDDNVIKCVAAQYYRLKFEPPEGGTVTVVYPIAFWTK